MAKAVWNGQTLAESEKDETVEGNIYFPEETVKREFLQAEFNDLQLPVEGAGAVLHDHRGRAGEPGCGVVLPRSEAGGSECEAPCGVLARRGNHEIAGVRSR